MDVEKIVPVRFTVSKHSPVSVEATMASCDQQSIVTDIGLQKIVEICETNVLGQTRSVQEIVTICSRITGYELYCNQIISFCNQMFSETLNSSHTIINLCKSFKIATIDFDSSMKMSYSNNNAKCTQFTKDKISSKDNEKKMSVDLHPCIKETANEKEPETFSSSLIRNSNTSTKSINESSIKTATFVKQASDEKTRKSHPVKIQIFDDYFISKAKDDDTFNPVGDGVHDDIEESNGDLRTESEDQNWTSKKPVWKIPTKRIPVYRKVKAEGKSYEKIDEGNTNDLGMSEHGDCEDENGSLGTGNDASTNSNFNAKKREKRKHLRKMSDTIYTCSFCDKNYKTKSSFKQHERSHRPADWEDLEKEEAVKHKKKICIEDLKCGFCGRITSTKKSLQEHIRTHTGEKPYVCEVCGSSFAQSSSFRAHQLIHMEGRPVACELCDYTCLSKRRLKRHMVSHSQEKKYQCEECGNRYARITSLHAHMNAHAGIKAHACDQCNKRFVRRTHMLQHRKIHTEEMPYSCKICGKRSRQAYNITVHMRTHTGHKPFACEICGKKFAHNVSLQQHKNNCTVDIVSSIIQQNSNFEQVRNINNK